MNWKEIEIQTTNQAFSAVSNLLEEAGASGLFTEQASGSENEIIIKAYFEETNDLAEDLKEVERKIDTLRDYDLDIGPVDFKVNQVQEEDWANKWKENFKPFNITEDIVIKPTWEKYEAQPQEIIIEIDPGQAFGTGHHVTTSSCLEAIEANLTPQTSVLDLGTGTGILAIAAAKLGAAKIVGLDIDPVAVKAARANAKLNGVSNEIEFLEGNLVDSVEYNYDLVVANILPHIILQLIPNLKEVMHPDSTFILSGIVVEKLDEIKQTLADNGFIINNVIRKSEENDDWVTITGASKE
ncbi:50S ribosomal protein L11 methyltransferase [Halanaerobacter jeridensis]|uniref:Ribosomal protein L11 methyltransferase n=1 Tax=Halanaerobacter jeridensis TaxID=706427 RepID=A0A938XSV3_9FIRM|nr:50S ribosomal protein L11 methyltransferase [Halanaerobacter jeridensis]MBM7556234.1 ribosomal protein L11 methyltransferase [Halanaerobacter jeridensis]